MLLLVATSFIERGLNEVVPGSADRVLVELEHEAQTLCSLQLPALVYCRSHCLCSRLMCAVEQKLHEPVWYAYKYCSKSLSMPSHAVMLFPCCAAPPKWHAQAQILSCALPTDVVRVIGAHVREQAAVLVQKWVRDLVNALAVEGTVLAPNAMCVYPLCIGLMGVRTCILNCYRNLSFGKT